VFNNVPTRSYGFVGAEAIGIEDLVKKDQDEIVREGYVPVKIHFPRNTIFSAPFSLLFADTTQIRK